MRILREETLAVIVDIQERLFPHIAGKEELAKNLQTLIKGLQILEVPLKVTEQYRKGLGETIPELKELLKGVWNGEKTPFSCCDDTSFMQEIEGEARKFIVLAGIESHICVLQTAIDLKALGYIPVVIEDCIGSRNPENKRIAVNRLLQSGIIVSSTESLLFELCRYSGNDTFKAISKLVK
jgi:nicotinamidase-related amidase